jgi:hypothetical protein
MAVHDSHANPGAEPPMTAEALLALDNVPAKRKRPPNVAKQLATRLLYLSRPEGGKGMERALEDASQRECASRHRRP